MVSSLAAVIFNVQAGVMSALSLPLRVTVRSSTANVAPAPVSFFFLIIPESSKAAAMFYLNIFQVVYILHI